MPPLGDKWVTELVAALREKDIIPNKTPLPGDLGKRIEAGLKALVAERNRAHGFTQPRRRPQPDKPADTEPRLATHIEVPTYFDAPLVIVSSLQNFGAIVNPEVLKDCGFGRVAVISHHGAARDETDESNIARFGHWAGVYRSLGIAFGTWGYLDGTPSPAAEAAFAAEDCRRLGADFYLANAEKEYSFIDHSGAQSPAHAQRSHDFVQEWKRQGLTIPTGLLTYGTIEAIDYPAWLSAGWTTKIAELFNGAAVDPHFAVDQARREGFKSVIPLVGYHQPVPFDTALKASGGKKIALYTGENFNEGQYREIKALRG
jgi:hypothetical protein